MPEANAAASLDARVARIERELAVLREEVIAVWEELEASDQGTLIYRLRRATFSAQGIDLFVKSIKS